MQRNTPSKLVVAKISCKQLGNGSFANNFQLLLGNLLTIVGNQCRRQEAEDNEVRFTIDTMPSPEQANAFQLLS